MHGQNCFRLVNQGNKNFTNLHPLHLQVAFGEGLEGSSAFRRKFSVRVTLVRYSGITSGECLQCSSSILSVPDKEQISDLDWCS